MFIFQKVRVHLLCAVLLILIFILGSFSLNTSLTVTAQNSLETSPEPTPLVPTGCPSASFNDPINVSVAGSSPQSVTSADFNNDGNLDLVTANIVSSNISLLLGNKNGVFVLSNTFSTETGIGARSVTNGDFNRDGFIDVATANFSSNSVAIFLGNGQGTFSSVVNFELGEGAVGPIFIKSLDLNRDGILDLVTANFSSANISILLGDGLGGFTNVTKVDITGAIGARSIATDDFNRDGAIDLAVVNFNSNNISILLGNGAGGIVGQTILPLDDALLPFSILSGDFNSDGSTDLATANGNDSVSVLLGSPSGIFNLTPTIFLTPGSNPQSIQVADFNQDGKLDLITANAGSNDISALLGDGNGNFSNPTNINLAGVKGVLSLLVTRLNQDTRPDLVVVNQGSGNISVLVNNCNAQCSGNFSNALSIPISDAATPQSLLLDDFNRDGVPDVITANSGNGNVSLLQGIRGGAFVGTSNFTTSGIQPFSVTSGDFNQDGTKDIATVDIITSNVYILLGDGNGSFGVPTTIALTSVQPVAILAADFNRDNFVDLVTANAGSSTISFLAGSGSGLFSNPVDYDLNGGAGPFALVTADFNRDGFPDLATANLASNNISILTGGLVGLSLTVNNFGVGSNSPKSIDVGDVNNDGNIDIITGNIGSNSLSVLFGDGKAGFILVTNISLNGGLKPSAVAIADFNLDGNLDLVVANSASDNISLFFGDGGGRFAFNSNLPLKGKTPVALVARDINQDGTIDLIVANSASVNISLLLNLCTCNISINPTSLPLGQKGVLYNQTITATSSTPPYSFALFDGALPNGITLSPLGQISGVTDQAGIFNFTVNIADASGCNINQNYSLLVGSAPATMLVIEAPKEVSINQPFDITLRATDENANDAIGYLGTVGFSSSDSNDLLPNNFTFSFVDLGKRVFSNAITLKSLGTHRIIVTDVNTPSIRAFIDFQVNKVNTKTSVSALENPTTKGEPATFTATVIPATPTTNTPTGTITFIIDGVAQTPITIINGEASFSTSTLSVGNHQIVVRYNGDSLFNSSVSNSFTQRVTNSALGGGGGDGGNGGDGGDGGDGGGGGDGSGGKQR